MTDDRNTRRNTYGRFRLSVRRRECKAKKCIWLNSYENVESLSRGSRDREAWKTISITKKNVN